MITIIQLSTGDYVGFEVLMAVTMKSMVFWVIMLCDLETAQHFGGT
jgi:hypothetical protein